jgi:hypothetical protein
MATALTTMMSSQTMAYTVSYSLLLISVITVAGLVDPIVIYKLFYNIDMPSFTQYFRIVYEFLPCFHFVKIYGDISRITCFHHLPEEFLWIPGREYQFEDMFATISGKLATQDRYIVPPMVSNLKKLYSISLMYVIIAWYFDHVLASNRGTAEPFYFFLKPTFWFSSCLKKYRTQKSSVPKHRKSSFTSIDISSAHHKTPISTAYEEKRLIKMMENEK